jgi:hypothetical protein
MQTTLGTKLNTRVQKCKQTWVKIFVPVNKMVYPGTKIQTQAQNFMPRYKTLYPGTELRTQVQNLF